MINFLAALVISLIGGVLLISAGIASERKPDMTAANFLVVLGTVLILLSHLVR
jgi:hypothetical protein